MLSFHLNESIDVSSRTGEFINRSVEWITKVNQLNGFWSSNKYYGFFNTFKYNEDKVVLDKYTIIEFDRTRTIYNWLQYFSPEKLEREFMEASFFVKELYSDVAGTPYNATWNEFAVIAERL
jgi:hypothetical protein